MNENVEIDCWIKSFNNQLHTMRKEFIDKNIKFKNLNAIFFGGGTPSLMPLKNNRKYYRGL